MLKKLSLILLISILVLFTLVITQKVDPEQIDPQVTSHVFEDTLAGKSYDWDSMMNLVGSNKKLPPGYEKAALLALAAYPQLKDVSIEMVLTNSGAPMESNFVISSLFGKRKDRIYQVLLNDASNTPYDEILLRNLPFDAQVGILAHELGHVVYYDNLSTLQIAKWGLLYLVDNDFRASHEKSTDLMPVYHGLGSQIYQYAYFVRNDPTCEELYEKYGDRFIDKFYLTDKEIAAAIEKRIR